jgi:hypothetical protein
MQVQNGREKPCVFVSHVQSEQATRWGIMELELYSLVHCVKQLLIGTTVYSEDGSQESIISIEQYNPKIGALEGDPLGVSVRYLSYPGNGQCGCGWTN